MVFIPIDFFSYHRDNQLKFYWRQAIAFNQAYL